MNFYSPSRFSLMPPVVKNLLIINGLLFFATIIFSAKFNFDLNGLLGLYYPLSVHFKWYQVITYMFMHGSFMHIFSNMFALWMFGTAIENIWGSKRFAFFYLTTGIGAAFFNILITYLRISYIESFLTPDQIYAVIHEGYKAIQEGMNYSDPHLGTLNLLININSVGASGAIFGLLLAFGMMFPNTLIYLYFFVPIKAKYFVILYGVFELYSGIMNQPGDNVAHFAHLGGMLFGFILIKIWQQKLK